MPLDVFKPLGGGVADRLASAFGPAAAPIGRAQILRELHGGDDHPVVADARPGLAREGAPRLGVQAGSERAGRGVRRRVHRRGDAQNRRARRGVLPRLVERVRLHHRRHRVRLEHHRAGRPERAREHGGEGPARVSRAALSARGGRNFAYFVTC